MKPLIVLALLAIVASLGQALFSMSSGPDHSAALPLSIPSIYIDARWSWVSLSRPVRYFQRASNSRTICG